MKLFMKHLISHLIQFPVFFAVPAGLKVITGLSVWWCIPIALISIISYDIGYEMTRKYRL